MNKKQKNTLYRIVVALSIFIVLKYVENRGMSFKDIPTFILPCLFLVPYFIAGYDVLWRAVRNIAHGQVFDENFLMMIATVGAFIIGEYSEGVFVMVFYQVGELFQSYAVNQSRQSIADLMDICPEYANIEVDGEIRQVDPDDVAIGDTIVVKPGEKVPLDGKVIEGESYLDTSALTGESVPRKVQVGEAIFSGCVNQSNVLYVEVEKEFDDSTVTKILEMVENASSRKAKTENFITHFAKFYTPIVVVSALILAVVPSLMWGQWQQWIERACIFLVISCPCALVISVPLGFFGGIGAASKHGVLVKGSNYLEALARADTVVFDKTGTLTKGEFKVTKIVAVDEKKIPAEQLLEMAALGEMFSDHPIAESIKKAYQGTLSSSRISDVTEVAGYGIKVMVDGKEVLLGNAGLMKEYQLTPQPCTKGATVVHVGIDGQYAGYILIADEVKEGAKKAIHSLKKMGIQKTVLLTGDNKEVAHLVGNKLGMDQVYAELLPGDKVEKVEELLQKKKKEKSLLFVGDGINDAPVLSRADVGIAMGSMGSDAAIEAADVVLMDDDIGKISTMMRISRKTIRIVTQNIVFALGVKILVLILGALGIATMWEAVFADVGVAVIAILNSMRTLRE